MKNLTLLDAFIKLQDMSKRRLSESNKCRVELALAAIEFVKHMANANSLLTADCEAEVVEDLITWSKKLQKAIDDAIHFGEE